MEKTFLSKNYFVIWNTFLRYLPSRFFIILNSLIIIPFLANILTSGEMGVFQLSLGILNLLCTCSTDWITKSVLRFWIKYKKKNKLESFFSSIGFITIFAYLFMLIIYFLFSDTICTKFSLDKRILLLTLFLVVPCGIRQFLYQLLRLFNKSFLYTFSIVIYQFSMICLFLLFSHNLSHVFALLEAMAISIFFIDFYVIKQIDLNTKLHLKPDFKLIKESLKYSLPLVITNVSLWAVFHANKFIFQYNHYFLDTAIVGISWFFTTSILAPVFSTFLFSVFPNIIKKFENKYFIKSFVTNTIQLYVTLFIPVVLVFCFFAKELTNTFLSSKYENAQILLPFFALSVFCHELLKLINIKYHLRNKTYIEMVLTLLIGLISLVLNIVLIPKLHILAAGMTMLMAILALIIINSFVKFKSIDYIEPKSIFKTIALTSFIATAVFSFVSLISKSFIAPYFGLIKIMIFLSLYYVIVMQFKAKILE